MSEPFRDDVLRNLVVSENVAFNKSLATSHLQTNTANIGEMDVISVLADTIEVSDAVIDEAIVSRLMVGNNVLPSVLGEAGQTLVADGAGNVTWGAGAGTDSTPTDAVAEGFLWAGVGLTGVAEFVRLGNQVIMSLSGFVNGALTASTTLNIGSPTIPAPYSLYTTNFSKYEFSVRMTQGMGNVYVIPATFDATGIILLNNTNTLSMSSDFTGTGILGDPLAELTLTFVITQ